MSPTWTVCANLEGGGAFGTLTYSRLSCNNNLMTRPAQGFTLIELLVVISIIAILSTIGMATFRIAQVRARDARRISDIKSIADALETNFTDGVYDTTIDPNWFVGPAPVDPINDANYFYKNTLSAVGFTSCAKLEGNTGGNYTDHDGTNKANTSGSGGYFCTKNRQ